MATLMLLSFAAFQNAHAQEGVKVGFRASPLIAWASVTNDSTKQVPEGLTTKAALGFSFDFVFTYGFSETVGFRSGINIATKGFSQEIGVTGFSASSKFNVTSLEVPVGLKFRSPEIGTGIHIIGHFGVNAELNLANSTETTATVTVPDPTGGPDITTTTTTTTKDVDGINFFTGSFVPGVGVDWEFDWGMLEFALTYHWGLLSLTDKGSQNFNQTVTKVSYIALNLGYFF